MAFSSTYWSGSELAGGKQAGPTVLEIATGASNVRMAMSLAWPKSKGSQLNVKNTNRFFVVVATYVIEGVVFVVKDNFGDPPRHLDVGLVR
jgi:hypothetical protein